MFPPDPRIMAEDAKSGCGIHWLAIILVLAGFALLIFFAVVPGIRMKLYDAHFTEVKQGMTADEIETCMGEADGSIETFDDLERYWGQDVQLHIERDAIVTTLSWRVRFMNHTFTWQVGLDADGRAIAKSRFKR